MDEDHVENDVEGLMYAALHYGNDTQTDVSTNKTDIVPDFDNVPQSNLRRYWRNNDNRNVHCSKTNTFNKSDTSKETISKKDGSDKVKTKLGDEKRNPTSISPDLSIFQQPVPGNVKKTIEILENDDDNRIVELETSEDDEVIEVALPPKPTITIESSDEDEIQITSKSTIEIIDKIATECKKTQSHKSRIDRDAATSPVPSVVSSVSDEFIRGDCIALNITSQNHNNESFDFGLHGSDLEQTPSKKKKKKRNKEATSTPLVTLASDKTVNSTDTCFATPKSKSKNKRQRRKSYQVSDTSIPNADVYDSDSNHSLVESVKSQNQYKVSDKSLPNTDVYESDSNNSENIRDCHSKTTNIMLSDIDSSENSAFENATKESHQKSKSDSEQDCTVVVDLTERSQIIDENIVMANVTGFSGHDTSTEDPNNKPNSAKCGSTKIPSILNEDLDFDNLKGNKVSKRQQYSVKTLRAEMEKFYNESWGGEDFNHREIQKNMSRDKSLWAIDPKDRMQVLAKRKTTCNYCNRVGHRDDTCRWKPAVCHMCGALGHFEPRCPKKMCLNCGTPTHIFTNLCRTCCNWNNIKCAECGHNGHPSSHCPDIWRRYHNATDTEPLEENRQTKKHYQLFCSGCSRRGHLVHTCRVSLPFSGLQVHSPYVSIYSPVYAPNTEHYVTDINQQYKQAKIKFGQQDIAVSATSTPKSDRNKRQSKSPCANEVPAKKKYTGPLDSELKTNPSTQKKQTQKAQDYSKETTEINKSISKTPETKNSQMEKGPDFLAVPSNNHDKKGQVIQDNEVSDTSEVITSARIYVTHDISEKLKAKEGEDWLKETTEKNNITIENHESNLYFSIKGTVGNQEAFQTELRDWIKSKHPGKEHKTSESDGNISQGDHNESMSMSDNIPKNKNNVLRKLSKALDTLKQDLGDPKALYKEATYLQNKHQQLLKQKVISPKQLSNNKDNMNLILRKLNMVLLGQAGLANGSKHVSELILLQEKVNNLRQKNIPLPLRQEIGVHFHFIFTSAPRDDYAQLLSKYYGRKVTLKKNNTKYFKSPNSENINVSLSLCPTNVINDKDLNGENKAEKVVKSARIEKARNKLVLVHTRLSLARPVDSVLKKTKEQLIRELYQSIRLLRYKSEMTPKIFKKVKKAEQQAQLFLTNL